MIKTYSIVTDTVNNKLDNLALCKAIQDSTIAIALKTIGTVGDIINIEFKSAITTAEHTTLTALVEAHDGEPVEEIVTTHTISDIPEGGKKKTDRGFTFTATNSVTTTHDYVITEDLQIKGGLLQSVDQECQDSIGMALVDTAYTYAGLWYPADDEGTAWSVSEPDGYILHHYLKDFPVSIEGRTSIKNDAITTTPLNGLTVRITYKSTGTTDVKCNVGIVAYT